MNKDFIIAIYTNGQVVLLNSSDKLPGCEVVAFIRCKQDGQTSSKQNDYYAYELFDKDLERMDSNCLKWEDFECSIAKRDGWLQPLQDWSGSHHYEMRVQVKIVRENGENAVVNLLHYNHNGQAFCELIKLLTKAKDEKLSTAVEEFRKNSK